MIILYYSLLVGVGGDVASPELAITFTQLHLKGDLEPYATGNKYLLYTINNAVNIKLCKLKLCNKDCIFWKFYLLITTIARVEPQFIHCD